jgi:hypothetical protein
MLRLAMHGTNIKPEQWPVSQFHRIVDVIRRVPTDTTRIRCSNNNNEHIVINSKCFSCLKVTVKLFVLLQCLPMLVSGSILRVKGKEQHCFSIIWLTNKELGRRELWAGYSTTFYSLNNCMEQGPSRDANSFLLRNSPPFLEPQDPSPCS